MNHADFIRALYGDDPSDLVCLDAEYFPLTTQKGLSARDQALMDAKQLYNFWEMLQRGEALTQEQKQVCRELQEKEEIRRQRRQAKRRLRGACHDDSLAFIRELYDGAAPADCCPHLVAPDAQGCRCQCREGVAARMVCDSASLQLYCLKGPGRWPACVFFADVPVTAEGLP
jgi:hypothetical protein